MRKFVYIIGVIAFVICVLGAMFKVLHWPGANILLLTSMLLLVVFVSAAAWYRYHKTS